MISKEFKTRIKKALADENLGGALGRFAEAYVLSRANAYADAGLDFAKIREEIVALKDYAADHLEELADRFTLEAEKRGAHVLRTSSVEEVKKYIADLAEKHQVKTIVKAKSMASEEIYLNKHLEAKGLRVRETDLGEWIIQLAGQSPSHMVMPAIHLTKEEVADILGQEVQEKLASDIPRLVKVARRELRPDFLSAGIGITGANLAVAESGTLVIITNEGNARLASSMPPVHVALVGLEKLVASLEDVPKVLKALPRSATAQQLTSYVSFITGPVPTLVEGQVRPKELHIILMDNKRLAMRDDPHFKEALRCIRCASCLNVCPVYRLVGGHVYGHIYAGGIGTILTAFFNTKDDAKEIQALCLQCGLCKEFCPAQIDIPSLILELRSRLVQDKGLPFVEKTVLETVLSNRQLFHRLLRLASRMQRPWTGQSTMIRHLPLFFANYAEKRSLPAIASRPLRDRLPAQGIPGKKRAERKRKVAFYAGCLIDFAYPQLGEAVIKVLHHYGVDVYFPPGQTCCGAPAKYSGARDVAQKIARQNVEAFAQEDFDAVICACPTCMVVLQKDFPRLLAGDWIWEEKARALAEKVRDFSDYVWELEEELKLQPFFQKMGLKVVYHDSCHYKRSLGLAAVPRQLLSDAGYQLVEMKDADHCCGLAGSYTIKFPELSLPILERKLSNIEKSNPAVVAMDCPGCVLQIAGGLDKKQSGIQAKHTAELLAEALAD